MCNQSFSSPTAPKKRNSEIAPTWWCMLCRAFATMSRNLFGYLYSFNKSHIVGSTARIHTLFHDKLKGAEPKEKYRINIQIRPCKMCVGAKFNAENVCLCARCNAGRSDFAKYGDVDVGREHKSFHFLRTCGTNYSFLVYRRYVRNNRCKDGYARGGEAVNVTICRIHK